MAGALAAEAAVAAENGRWLEAAALWGTAAEYLTHLTAFDPTREAMAALFLARAADLGLLAAQGTGMAAAGELAKVAELVFFGKAAPGAILEVLRDTPAPLEFDPCKAPTYRMAAGYLAAAHWVLTGREPKTIAHWVFNGRWEPKDAEALLLFSLDRQNMGWATGHLYLGDLPY
jgi:hypothetical protein